MLTEFFLCGNFFHKKKLHKVVWKKKFSKKTTQLCAEKIFFKKNYTTLCGKNILKKNPHRLYGVLIYLIIKIVSCIFQEGDYEKG
ncbi:hypothetical protein AWN65_09720 [Flavobacterium covae]|nr:hypothetical protein AWN65_09720 [Flavobacterium covae]